MWARIAVVIAALATVAVSMGRKVSRPAARVRDWLPRYRSGRFEARDVLSWVLAFLAIYLSAQAIWMGERQERIANRQAEIAETQFRITQKQLGREAEASLVVTWGWGYGVISFWLNNNAFVPVDVTSFNVQFSGVETTVTCTRLPEGVPTTPGVVAPEELSRVIQGHRVHGAEDSRTVVESGSYRVQEQTRLLVITCDVRPSHAFNQDGFLLVDWEAIMPTKLLASGPLDRLSVPLKLFFLKPPVGS